MFGLLCFMKPKMLVWFLASKNNTMELSLYEQRPHNTRFKLYKHLACALSFDGECICTQGRDQHGSFLWDVGSKHSWTEPPVLSPRKESSSNDWLLRALWPTLRVIWLVSGCDSQCADCVSVRAWALTCLVRSLFMFFLPSQVRRKTSSLTRLLIFGICKRLYNSGRVTIPPSPTIFAVVISLFIQKRCQ